MYSFFETFFFGFPFTYTSVLRSPVPPSHCPDSNWSSVFRFPLLPSYENPLIFLFPFSHRIRRSLLFLFSGDGFAFMCHSGPFLSSDLDLGSFKDAAPSMPPLPFLIWLFQVEGPLQTLLPLFWPNFGFGVRLPDYVPPLFFDLLPLRVPNVRECVLSEVNFCGIFPLVTSVSR